MRRQKLMSAAVALAALVGSAPLYAQTQGECASGMCGTPKNNGGTPGGSGGGAILVANTDIGVSYSTSDDYDGDGFEDNFDNCPFLPNRTQVDADGDGVGDMCDDCEAVANKDQADADGDWLGDACDADADNDTIPNEKDNCPLVPNADQTNTDADAKGDGCDDDIDGDGLLNAADACPFVVGTENCDEDADLDGVKNAADNCMFAYNPDQLDADKDGMGDLCDSDADEDGIPNTQDNCKLVGNADQKDADRDGVGDACQSGGFCLVVAKNRAAPCLDPQAVFSVVAAPAVQARTGEKVELSMFANRQNTPIRYAWVVTGQPDGSADTVSNSQGSVSVSEAYEYRWADGKRPEFEPSHPGTYKITVYADLVTGDTLFPAVGHAEQTVEVTATGSVIERGAGCSTTPRKQTSGAGAAAVALGWGCLLLLRRRRSATRG